MRIVSATGLIIVSTCAAFSQSAPAPLAFEVASIKPAPPPTDGRLMIRMGGDAGRLDYNNVSLKDLLRAAYKVKDPQITGPDWMGSERFNLVAKLPEGASKDQVPAMLQTLLADRFKLTLHKEQKVVPAYALLVGKGGAKLHPAEGEGRLRVMMGPKGRHMSGVASMTSFADTISNVMDRPVIDLTGIKGSFDIDLEWSGDDGPQSMRAMRGPGGPEGGPRPEGAPRPEAHDESADAPSIFTALDKLGLKLDPRKEPVDILIIDHAEKVPTEN
jgi:uncharacterized protein (TIGR03435 family)